MNVNAVLGLNFRFAGALIDANRLIANGWRDIFGAGEGGEWLYRNSTWVEYVETMDGLEYRVQCSLGYTVMSRNENGSMKNANADFSTKAHELKVPRMAFLRRFHVWVCDEKAMTFADSGGDVPSSLVSRVEKDIAAAVLEPARLFADDIEFQTEWMFERDGDVSGGDVDRQFHALADIIKKELAYGTESVARLLTPFARAVLTDDDPKGRFHALGISDPMVLESIVDWARRSGFHAGVVAVMEVAVKTGLAERLPAKTWTQIAVSSIAAGCLREAATAMEHAFALVKRMDADEKEHRDTLASLYRAAVDLGRENSPDAEGFGLIIDALARNIDAFGTEAREPSLWVKVARCHLYALRDETIPRDCIESLSVALGDAVAAYDAVHEKDAQTKPYLKNLPAGVKVPLEWQSLLFSLIGDTGAVLKSFPEPISSNEKTYRYHPPIDPVEGLSMADVWGGFIKGEKSKASFDEWLDVTTKDLKVEHDIESRIGITWIVGKNDFDSYQVMTPKKPEASEVSSLCVRAKQVINGEEHTWVIGSFPYLPKEFEGNRPNVKGRVWRYHLWSSGAVADAEFETKSGVCVTAAMPYFIADYPHILRGCRMEGVMVGFAHGFKKVAPPDLPASFVVEEGPLAEEKGGPVTLNFSETIFDRFDQDNVPEEISGAGFDMQGRVKSVRDVKAFGMTVKAVEVDCGKLDEPLRVYVPAFLVDGPIGPGDTVEVFGWLYLDLFGAVGDFADYEAEYPVHAPYCENRYPWDAGVPTYVRTAHPDGDADAIPAEWRKPKWFDYGKSRLEQCKGVTQVVRCPPNPLSVDYLVKISGKVEKFRMVIVKDDSPQCLEYPGVWTFVLRLTPAKDGYNLSWERLPGDE